MCIENVLVVIPTKKMYRYLGNTVGAKGARKLVFLQITKIERGGF